MVPLPAPRRSFSHEWHFGQRKYLYSLRFLNRTLACAKAVRIFPVISRYFAFSVPRRKTLREKHAKNRINAHSKPKIAYNRHGNIAPRI
jgi:hypothetical protein